MQAAIVPEPPEPEREAILAALTRVDGPPNSAWADAALAEAVGEVEAEP